MVSPRLHHDIERRVRAEHSLDNDQHRSSSVPAALRRYHRREGESGRAVTAPAPGGRDSRGSAPRPQLMIARSSSPPSAMGFITGATRASSPPRQTDQAKQNQREKNAGEQSSSPYLMPKSRDTEDANIGKERPLSSEDRLSGADAAAEERDPRWIPRTTTTTTKMTTAAGDYGEDAAEKVDERSGEQQVRTPTSDLGTPKKLLELIEDRDRAVHLCLQVCGLWRGDS